MNCIMPSVNIPPKVRFALYLFGAIASLLVVYAVNKSWLGDPEVQLTSGLVALLNLMAASKTNFDE
jgi:hypothetical protein